MMVLLLCLGPPRGNRLTGTIAVVEGSEPEDLTVQTGATVSFDGWLELISALEAFRRGTSGG